MFLSYHHGPGPVVSEVYSFSALLKVNRRREETLERIDERCQNGFIYDFNKVIKHFVGDRAWVVRLYGEIIPEL